MDESLFRALNATYPGADIAWDLVNHPAVLGIFVVGVAWAAWQAKQGRWLLAAALAVGLTDLICARVLKPSIARERPCAVLAGVHVRHAGGSPACGAGESMPSNHAANTAALAAALGSGPLAVVSAFVGVSRVASGQHWPSDVAAGWGIGVGLGLGTRALARRALGWR